MKTLVYKCLFTLLLLVTSGGIANAQGFLSKVSKALSKVTNTTTASSLTDGNDTEADDSSTSDGDSTSIDWDAIPVYHLQVINETNDDGTPQLNTDGTPVTRVLLVDQFGNYRSQEAVEAQRKALKKYITQIIAKVGGGAALGAVTGLLSAGNKKNKVGAAAIGAGAGAVAGALLSMGDIKRARDLNKSLKEQDKLMEVYRKNFTNEGEKVDAAANIDDIEGLTLDKESAVSKTASEIKDLVQSETFNTPEAGIWDSI